MTDVLMPQMGESIAEGTITKWLKRVGDAVLRDEPLFEISTDKVDAEIPAPASGTLAEIRFDVGATVAIHTAVAVINESGTAAQSSAASAPVAAPGAPRPPTGADDRASASPAPPTRAVAPPQPVITTPLASPPPPDDLPAVQVAPADPAVPPDSAGRPGSPVRKEAHATAEELRRTRSSPLVRRIANEHGIDVRAIPGSGLSGRVTKQDILAHMATNATAPPAPPVPAVRASGALELVPMSAIRRKTAERMVESKRTSAHVTTVFEIDMTRVAALRERHRQSFEARGTHLTSLPFILKATVDALKVFPVLNASIEGEAIAYHEQINLGLAVALDWGLIVPVIHAADEKNVLGLARATVDLAERARSKKLRIEEVQGATFTVTNAGVFGGLFGTPIISQPQVAILCVGAIEKRPVVRDDAIAIRTMAYFALTFDHRLVDGADADRFMAQIKRSLEELDESGL